MKVTHNGRTKASKISLAEQAIGIEIVTVGRRAAYYARETDEWYWLSAADLTHAVACREKYGNGAYSHWCTGSGELVRSPVDIASLEK